MDINSVSTFFATGAALFALGVGAIVMMHLASSKIAAAGNALDRTRTGLAGYGAWLAWLIALAATLGSLYYSQVAHFVPCEYCWYQRIAMYPLAIILGIGAWRNDLSVRRYVYPLAVVGGLISSYHYLIQQLPNLAVGTCSTAAPCTTALVWKFDFVSIPFMALASFAAIITVLMLDMSHQEPEADQNTKGRQEGNS